MHYLEKHSLWDIVMTRDIILKLEKLNKNNIEVNQINFFFYIFYILLRFIFNMIEKLKNKIICTSGNIE